ncbi:hypothetical protein ACFWD7_19230 [Streptomyces mirabilis]|nr:hypothetical protein [Streptomyces mirabilis]MCT9104288.1 hypothetical protein [Streptomyces mirabilis]
MPVPNEPGQRIVAVTAAAGSSSQAALTPLAQVTAPRTRTAVDTDSVSVQ